MAEQTQAETAAVDVHDAELPEAADSGAKGSAGQIDILLDAPVTVSVEMGQVEVEIRDLLQVGRGSVLKLDRKVGEPLDLYLRGVRFATGDLVVVGEQLGVRIREILAVEPPANQQ
jgi:flagellar motor switch protein FliN/FliY